MVSNENRTSDNLRELLKQKPTGELIQIALTASDEQHNPGWDAIWVLQQRATREVFDAAKELCESDDPAHRSIGVTILAQFGFPSHLYLDEILDIFFHMIDVERDVDVLHSIGVGLGHTVYEPRKVEPLLKLKNHPNPEVRFGAAFGLCGEEHPLAIKALIELSNDENEAVRDWATFGLGAQIEMDSVEIREALFNRASDPDDKSDAPGEGLLGLAKRRDERAFELILKALAAGNAGTLIFEAAEALGDARLYTALVKLRDHPEYSPYERNCLEDAISACNGDDETSGKP